MIKNSKDFVEEAKTWNIDPNEIQVSYDVVALYPSVPINKAITNLMEMLQKDHEDFGTRTIFNLEHIKQLIEVCLYKAYFLCDNQIHCLEDSGPIGLSLMVILAESFLQMIENKAVTIAKSLPSPVNPITHKRYVDDCHDRFKTKEISEEFLSILNEQEPRIQFTIEYENSDKELNFLDINIINAKKNKYEFKIHRKAAITNIQIKPNSCHDDKIKDGIFKGYILRAKSLCSEKYLEDEIEFIKNIFIENGYERSKLDKIIRDTEKKKTRINENKSKRYTSLPWIPGLSQKLKKVFQQADCTVSFKSPRNLESILTQKNKPVLPKNSQPGVYFITTECGKGYTGETKKQVRTRTNEHEKAVFKGNVKDDALAEHSESCGCKINWETTNTLAKETVWFKRKVREALEIRRLKTGPEEENGLNRDLGDYVTTNTWSTLFDKINTKKRNTIA